MNRNTRALSLAASLCLATLTAGAETPDPAGQFATRTSSGLTRAQVQSELAELHGSDMFPWSDAYRPAPSMESTKTRAQVRAEFLQNREAASALSAEDGGSPYLAKQRARTDEPSRVAGRPMQQSH
jgi:hypothetical protein